MRKRLIECKLALLILAIAPGAMARPMVVFVRDYAGVAPKILRRAEAEAARITRTAGIELRWLHCPPTGDVQQCRDTADNRTLILDLLGAQSTRRNGDAGALGFASPPESGPFWSYAGVFCDRVEALDSPVAGRAVVLGHAMAHEIGHMLLGVGGHASDGIMKAEWQKRELWRAARGDLIFSASQRKRILDNVAQRLANGPRFSCLDRSNGAVLSSLPVSD